MFNLTYPLKTRLKTSPLWWHRSCHCYKDVTTQGQGALQKGSGRCHVPCFGCSMQGRTAASSVLSGPCGLKRVFLMKRVFLGMRLIN